MTGLLARLGFFWMEVPYGRGRVGKTTLTNRLMGDSGVTPSPFAAPERSEGGRRDRLMMAVYFSRTALPLMCSMVSSSIWTRFQFSAMSPSMS